MPIQYSIHCCEYVKHKKYQQVLLKLKHVSSRFPFSLLELSNSTNWTEIFAIQKLYAFQEKPSENLFNCHNFNGALLVTRLTKVEIIFASISSKVAFKMYQQSAVVVRRQLSIEASAIFLFHCSNCSMERSTFQSMIRNIDRTILRKADLQITETLHYDDNL